MAAAADEVVGAGAAARAVVVAVVAAVAACRGLRAGVTARALPVAVAAVAHRARREGAEVVVHRAHPAVVAVERRVHLVVAEAVRHAHLAAVAVAMSRGRQAAAVRARVPRSNPPAVVASPPRQRNGQPVVEVVIVDPLVAAHRNFRPAIARPRETAPHNSQRGPVVRIARVVRIVPAPARRAALRSFPRIPEANRAPEEGSRIAQGTSPHSSPARVTSGTFWEWLAGWERALHWAQGWPIALPNYLRIGQEWPTVPAPAPANIRHGPSNDRTGASARKAATSSGISAWITETTPGTSAPTIARRRATTSTRIRTSAGTTSITPGKTAKNWAGPKSRGLAGAPGGNVGLPRRSRRGSLGQRA